MENILCPYCGNVAQFVTGAQVYPHRKDLSELRFYWCEPCDAFVGSHLASARPLGTLANKELRDYRKAVHMMFDPLWRGKEMSRTQAYKTLRAGLRMTPRECHIAMFGIDECRRAVAFLKTRKKPHEL